MATSSYDQSERKPCVPELVTLVDQQQVYIGLSDPDNAVLRDECKSTLATALERALHLEMYAEMIAHAFRQPEPVRHFDFDDVEDIVDSLEGSELGTMSHADATKAATDLLTHHGASAYHDTVQAIKDLHDFWYARIFADNGLFKSDGTDLNPMFIVSAVDNMTRLCKIMRSITLDCILDHTACHRALAEALCSSEDGHGWAQGIARIPPNGRYITEAARATMKADFEYGIATRKRLTACFEHHLSPVAATDDHAAVPESHCDRAIYSFSA